MAAPRFWEVLDRACNTGPREPVKEFDLRVWKTTSRLAKEHEIRYDPANPVNCDDGLADDLWKAGVELYAEVGSYCMDSERVIRFDEREIKDGLREVRDGVTIGSGSEERTIHCRTLDDKSPPTIIGGIIESDVPEGDMFVKVYQSIAQEPIIDGFYVGPPVQSAEGYKLRITTPLEIHLGRCAAGWAREAIRRAGRPGLHLASACPSAAADIASCDEAQGIRRTDAIVVPTTAELKTDYQSLGKVAFSVDYGCLRNPYSCNVIGGWAGGPEGTAIVAVACSIMSVMVYQNKSGQAYGEFMPMRMQPAIMTDRQATWGNSICSQAIAKNSRIVNIMGITVAAGPGTEMMYYETAENAVATIPSGSCGVGNVRRYKVKSLLGSPLENKFYAEAAYAATRLKRSDANEIVKALLAKYESKITDEGGPLGYPFDEIYDMRTLTPKKEQVEIYDRVKKEVQDLGLEFNYP